MSSLVVGASLAVSAVAGAVAGGLFAFFFWEWDGDPTETRLAEAETVVYYGCLGVIGGLIVGGLIVAVVGVTRELRGRRAGES